MTTRAGVIARFRNRWALQLTDACVIETATGDSIDGSGTRVVTWSAVYTGSCLVWPLSDGDSEAGGIQVETRGYDVRIPYDETTVSVDDRVRVTASADGYLTGKILTVRNVEGDSFMTVRRLVCEDVL